MKIIRPPLFMRPHPDLELEQAIDRELRSLPDRPAPASLAPRVLRAIAERQRLPWWRKSFTHWPAPARLLFLVASTCLAGLLVYLAVGLSSGATLATLGTEARELAVSFGILRRLGDALGGATLTLARAAGPWLGWSLVTIAGISYLTTVALGTVCWRLATRRL